MLGQVISVKAGLVVGLDELQALLEVLGQRLAAIVEMVEYAELHVFSPAPQTVIPGLPDGQSPESIFRRPVFMDSGLAAPRRPGMTLSLLVTLLTASCR